MQNEFKQWLNTMEFDKENARYNELIENRLIKIAKENDCELIHRSNLLGKGDIYLIFQNKKNQKFISAWANEKGFYSDDYDELL